MDDFLSSETLAVDYTWDTQCKGQDAEGAFLICGTLYVVYNTRYGGRSTVQCLFDIHDTIHRLVYCIHKKIITECISHLISIFLFLTMCSDESPVIFFPKRYTSHSSIHYHPGDKQLYAWDDGYQTMYKVETRRNEPVIAE